MVQFHIQWIVKYSLIILKSVEYPLSVEKSQWLCRVVQHVFSCSGHWYKRRRPMRIHWDNGRAWEQTLGLNFLFLHWKTSLMMYWCWTLIPKKKKKRKKENPNNNNKSNKKNPDGGIFIGYLQLWTLCDPMDYSLLGSSVHGIFHTRTLEWVAISFSRGFAWHRNRTGAPVLEAHSLPAEPPG